MLSVCGRTAQGRVVKNVGFHEKAGCELRMKDTWGCFPEKAALAEVLWLRRANSSLVILGRAVLGVWNGGTMMKLLRQARTRLELAASEVLDLLREWVPSLPMRI